MAVRAFFSKGWNTLRRMGTGAGANQSRDSQTSDSLHLDLNEEGSRPSFASPTRQTPDEDEEDDVVFRKNNVFLKYPSNSSGRRRRNSASTSSDRSSTDDRMDFCSSSEEENNLVLVPGYFYITTRGTDFGQTLILNWTPNSIMSPSARKRSPEKTGSSDKSDRPSCSSVSIDLGRMETIRVFYTLSPDSKQIDGGEIVISSRERRFKVFCFKNHNLRELIRKFKSWKTFDYRHQRQSQQYIFTIARPRLCLAELHVEEPLVGGVLTRDMWRQLMDCEGRIPDNQLALQTIFFRGMEVSLRQEVWPILLGVVPFESSEKERREGKLKRHDIFRQITAKRERAGLESLGTDVLQLLDEDIDRTDRTTLFFEGENNPNLLRLKNNLLNYLIVYRPDISYCQGMTDLLAPLLSTLDNDSEAFFCFTQLVEKTVFFKPAKNSVSLERQLVLLRALTKLLLPWFHTYLSSIPDGLLLSFSHRWLLVCLKREFKENDYLTIWEAVWTNYETNSFLLFVCIAIMAMYGQRVLDEEMNANELTAYFTMLNQKMPIDIVLTQARGYLFQFTRCETVPCTLRSIMRDEFWFGVRNPRRPSCPKLVCECGRECVISVNGTPTSQWYI